MNRKWIVILGALIILSLLGSGLAVAEDGLPTWVTAFDPGDYMEDYYLIQAVEEFKEELYVAAGNPLWFGDEDGVMYGQVFHSPDGANWAPASEPGFGLGVEGENYYETAWDMTVFGDGLYLLAYDTDYYRPGVILRSRDGRTWESVATADELGLIWDWPWGGTVYGQFYKFGVFDGMLYVNGDFFDEETGLVKTVVLRSRSGDPGSWELVADFFGWFPSSFHVFKGALYLASDGVYTSLYAGLEPLPEQIWRTFDGIHWEMVVGDGFGNPGEDGMGGFADYAGYLYVGAGTWGDYGGQIWRTKNGVQWEPVILDGFGYPLNVKVDGLVVYAGELYAYTVNWVEGSYLFRTKDAKSWEAANEPGWGDPSYGATQHEAGQAIFKDELYMGVIGPQGVLVKMLHPDQ